MRHSRGIQTLVALLLSERIIKRAFDIAFTTIATAALLPVVFIVGLLIMLDSPGPVLFRSTRVGGGGKKFTLYKFRTMVANAHALGPSVTHKDDLRVTRIGRFLRRTKFDEFPQVLNVLRGDMSIVGPRPELPEYVALYSPEQRKVLEVLPGLTSLAQVIYRDEEKLLPEQGTVDFYVNKVLPYKLALDQYYARNWSLVLDFKVFLIGLLVLFRVPTPSILRRFKEKIVDACHI